MSKKIFILIGIFFVTFCFGGCKNNSQVYDNQSGKNLESSGQLVSVYLKDESEIREMELETYIQGVLAGEIYNNWNIEAIKAQAVIARTFALDFIENKESKYDGADISSDITEAQAYSETNINENIKQAVLETSGEVLMSDGEYVDALFHSNSGGKTATLLEGFGSGDGNSSYAKVTSSPENAENSQNFEWQVELSKSEILKALKSMGVLADTVSSFSIGEYGESGRALTFKIGNSVVSAPTFRLSVGSTKFKSTLITKIEKTSSGYKFSGKGYGHGVGLSQWGAKILADQGKGYKEILDYYFQNCEIVKK